MGTIRYIYKHRKEWNCSRPYQNQQELAAWLSLDKASEHRVKQTRPTDYTVYINDK